jgi:ribonuclease VapC
MSRVVFDASAILAVSNGERGSERVIERSHDAVMSSVNVAEVYARLLRAGVPQANIDDGLTSLVTTVVPFDPEMARTVGEIHAATRFLGLSLADCACLAVARQLDLPALTTDRVWAELRLPGVIVELIR